LRRQGFDVYLPQFGRQRRHARRTDIVRLPLFPGYLFLHMDLSNSRWHSVNSTVGVHSLLCHGRMPAAVPEGVVEELRARETGDGLVPLRSLVVLEQGETLRIVEGPLNDRVGIYEKMTGGERVVLLLRLLGREVRVVVPLSATRSA
jgi:transcriptional antiterminator RfaH